jgi:hypothetical protein
VFLLVRLCPVFEDTFQPVSDLPSKILTKPVSSNFSGFGQFGANRRSESNQRKGKGECCVTH